MADAAEIRALIAAAEGRAEASLAIAQTYRTRLDAIESKRQLADLKAEWARMISDDCEPWFKVEPSLRTTVISGEAGWFQYLARKEAAAASERLQDLYSATQAAVVTSAGFKPPSDPAEPEPAVHIPKPIPPGPLSGAELHEVAVHAADSMDVPRYVGRYFEARRQVGRLLDAPLG